MCFSSLSLEPWEEFCWPDTFLDLSLSLLTAAAALPFLSPILLHFHCLTLPVPPQPSSSILACRSRSHFHLSGSLSVWRLSVFQSHYQTVNLHWLAAGEERQASLRSGPCKSGQWSLAISIRKIYYKNDIYSGHTFGIISHGKMYQWETKVFVFRAAC